MPRKIPKKELYLHSKVAKIMTPIKINLTKCDEPQLIVGLGNIGNKYAKTRHNAGFFFIDALLDLLEGKGFLANHTENNDYELWSFPQIKLALMKPKTLMNLSGRAVKTYYRYHGEYSSKHCFIAHDDLDILLGDYKISEGKGPRLHNGLKSLEQELGTAGFIRVRLGIDNRQGVPISGLDYVLYKFKEEEIAILNSTIKQLLLERTIS